MVPVCYGEAECAKIVDEALRHFDRQRLVTHFICGYAESRSCAASSKCGHIRWKICFTAGSRSVHGLSIDCSDARGLCGNEATSIVSCGDEKHFRNCVRYIRRNPEKAHLKPGEYILYESDVAKQIE